ncbi:hypothetical protein ATL40_1953 [Serinibacter salmoneus]|uniref:VCBS repeat protein n=2 Tax=Serinibacter salmoneus TaxID=556530 RepID=A0A2A9D282_9MICO|nr:hypothetical protein ATL40_1953 [Serinibacter salmoneus]
MGLAVGASALVAPSSIAAGGEVGGSGQQYFLNDQWGGEANHAFNYGRVSDQVYVGDWDGDGRDTLAVRRGQTYYFSNGLGAGAADVVVNYGRASDVVYVGDWDGDGRDTLAVRRGRDYHIKNSLNGGGADAVVPYGRSSDVVLVGDWDGDGDDTLAVRRGQTYHVKNTLTAGAADRVFNYGRTTDRVYVGDWNRDSRDTFGVRRGRTYYLANSLSGGSADRVVTYGRDADTTIVGDWNGDGSSTLGVRRPPAAPIKFGDGTHLVGADIPAGVYRSQGAEYGCYWERLGGVSGEWDELLANEWGSPRPIVEVKSSDFALYVDDCGTWTSLSSTFPAHPAERIGNGSYVVNRDFRPGTYHVADPGEYCSWERVSSFDGESASTIGWGFTSTVSIRSSDVGFISDGCGNWHRIGD